jgi:hypothetical protein
MSNGGERQTLLSQATVAGALKQLGIGVLGIGVAVVTVFVLSNVTVRVLAAFMRGITTGDIAGDAAATAVGAAAQL